MRILYAFTGGRGETSVHRLEALKRIGHLVESFDYSRYFENSPRAVRWLRYQTMSGLSVRRLNRDIVATVRETGFDLVWFDKAVWLWPETVRAISQSGPTTVHFNPDNPFRTGRGPGWRLFLAALRDYDVHVTPRERNVEEYRSAGARTVLLMPFGYEPSVHFPPPDEWGEADRRHDVTFLGSPYGDVPQFIRALSRKHGIRVQVRGDAWETHLRGDERESHLLPESMDDRDYREMIWRSKINLGFIHHGNFETLHRRLFAIPASGGFLLAEVPRGGKLTHLVDGVEAVSFSGLDDCAEHIRRYLDDRAVRESIAAAGYERVISSGYSNDDRLRQALASIKPGLD